MFLESVLAYAVEIHPWKVNPEKRQVSKHFLISKLSGQLDHSLFTGSQEKASESALRGHRPICAFLLSTGFQPSPVSEL